MNAHRFKVVTFFLCGLCLWGSTTSRAQQASTNVVVSPEVGADRRVTFRVAAPKASEVGLFGDWMTPNTLQPMTRDAQGIWTITVGPLSPGLAIYTVTIDGVTTPDPLNPRIKLRARTSASLVDVPGNPPELWQAQDVPHGKVEIQWAPSRVTGDTRAYYVYTPPGYDPRKSRRYPVLYLLHGNNDTAAGWTDVGKANFILDNLIAQHRAVPMIIVMPWGHAVPYVGPQAQNAEKVERYLIEEVMPQVDAHYHVATGREHRAIVGLSMGGGHALQIGFRHLDRFSAVGAFSYAIPGDFQTKFQDFLSRPSQSNAQLKLLWLGCGREDGAFENDRSFSDLLTKHQIQHVFRDTPGLHNFDLWRRYLAEVVPLLFQKP